MIDRQHPLPVTHQCQLLALARSSVYYTPQPVSAATLAVMRQVDELHLEYPFAGSRMLRDLLRLRGVRVGRKHVATLMRRMGIAALYRHPRTTQPHPGHQVFPYLLRTLDITAPNQVWAMDLTYLPMRHGFLYLVAVLDWATRRVLAWRLSNTLTTDFCLDALEAAIRDYGCPGILNTDQGSQFTSTAFVAWSSSTASRSAWTGRAPGATTASSNASGRASSTKKCTCMPMTPYPTPSGTWPPTSPSTIVVHTTPPRYVRENTRVPCRFDGTAGVSPRRTRSTKALAASVPNASRWKIHGPSGRGCSAMTSPRATASRSVRGLRPTRAAASVRLSQPAATCASRLWQVIR